MANANNDATEALGFFHGFRGQDDFRADDVFGGLDAALTMRSATAAYLVTSRRSASAQPVKVPLTYVHAQPYEPDRFTGCGDPQSTGGREGWEGVKGGREGREEASQLGTDSLQSVQRWSGKQWSDKQRFDKLWPVKQCSDKQ